MAAGKTSKISKTKTQRKTAKAERRGPSRPTISHASTLKERKELVSTCEGIGALIIAGQHTRMSAAIETLQKQARVLLLQQHLDAWVPRFEEHYGNLEKVFGEGLEVDEGNLMGEIKSKVAKAGFANMREFLVKVMLPVVSYHGLMLFLNNDAGVALPPEARDKLVARMRGINRLLGGTCAAMVLQDTMGV